MNRLQIILLFFLLSLSLNIQAQEFKIIKDTTDYILKEIDSAYYYSHGKSEKNLFVLDSSILIKENEMYHLKFENGKIAEIGGPESFKNPDELKFDKYIGLHKKTGYYLFVLYIGEVSEYYIVDKRNGSIVDISPIEPPILSPNVLNYCKSLHSTYKGWDKKGREGIEVINFKSKNWTMIETMGEFQYQVKWINDKKFLFYTKLFDKQHDNREILTYYLVEIKH